MYLISGIIFHKSPTFLNKIYSTSMYKKIKKPFLLQLMFTWILSHSFLYVIYRLCFVNAALFYKYNEHSESADLCQGSSIRITPNIFFMDPDSDPDHSHNLITCSLSHLGHILIISLKSILNFLSYLSLHFMDPEDPDSDPDHSQN